MKSIFSKKILLCLTSFFVFLFVTFCGILLPINIKSSFAFTSENTGSDAVKINELWLDSVKKFNGDNVNLLLQLISNDVSSNVFDLSKIKQQATATKDASEIRQTELTATFNGINLQKSNGQDIIVTLGGLDWTVTYLSQDQNNNPILTLWLANSEQLSGKVYYSTGYGTDNYTTSTYGVNGTARWSFRNGSPSGTSGKTDYPDNMYATSYMRSIILNNGGVWSQSTGGGVVSNWEKTPDNAFAPFTVSQEGEFNDIVDFIVTPSDVMWQKNQSFINQFSQDVVESMFYYNRSNEAWDTETSSDGFLTASYNYATKPNSDVWKNDTLWLPSLTEVGYSIADGIWATSKSQRSEEAVNTGFRTAAANNNTQVAYVGFNSDNAQHSPVDNSYSVRPALHLNLNTVVEHTTTERDISLCEFNTLNAQQWNPVKNIIPEITVTDNLFVFQPIKDVDYKIVVPEITGPGIVEIRVVGQDRYKGEKIVTLELTERELSLALKDNNLEIEDQTFCNDYITPVFENLKDYGYLAPDGDVKVDETGTPTNLVQNTDYTLSYENNFDKGVATITITGINKYTGTATTTFNIITASILEGSLTLNKNSIEYYYGEDLLKEIVETLVLDGLTLVKNKDYTINYYNELNEEMVLTTITEIGNYYAVVTGIGNYRDSKTINLEVTKATLKDEFITLENSSYTYTGFSIKPNFVVSFKYIVGETDETSKTYTFKEFEDFTTEFGDNILVSTGGTVTITGTGKFRGTANVAFEISPKNIDSEDIVASDIENQNYFVSALTPDFTLTDNTRNITLELNLEYKVVYSENVNVGTAVITISGIGNYSGTRIKNFNIIERDINLATFDEIENETYTGDALTPTLTIKDRENKTLELNLDFVAEYSNNINITDEAIVVVTGIGNYKGTKQLTFVIDPRSIASGVVSLNPQTEVFNGSSFSPQVTLTLDGVEIEQNIDETNVNYEIEFYFNNNKVSEMTNVGVYTIKVIGKNNYSRETSTTFEITKYDISNTTANEYTNTYSYNKLTQTPTITLNYGELVLENEKDFTTAYFKEGVGSGDNVTLTQVTNPTDAGTYQIVLTGINNYKGEFKNLSFTITTISLDDCVVTYSNTLNLNDLTFDNSAKKAEITSIKIGDVEVLDVSTDSIKRQYVTIAFLRNENTTNNFVNVGDITISVTPATQNLTGSYSRTYTIKQKNLEEAKTNGSLKITGIEDRTYTRQKQVFNITIVDESANNYTLINAKDYSISITDDCIYVKQNIEITISSVASGNYIGTIVETFSIVKAVVDSFTLQNSSGVYNGRVHTIVPVVKAGQLVLSCNEDNSEYAFTLTKNGKPTVELDLINFGEITVTVSLVDTDNFDLAETFNNTQIYTINSVEVSTITLRQRSVQYDTLPHTIVIDKVTTKNGIALLTDEYTVKYNGTSENTYTNATTVVVEVTGLGNYTGTATTNFVITPRPIKNTEIAYYIANDDGSASTNLIALTNKYKGEYVVPDINIAEGGTNLKIDTDYTFGVYLTSDKQHINNLYKTDGYLEVGSYQFITTGKGNFSGTITQNYVVTAADFNQTTIAFNVPNEMLYTGDAITVNFEDEAVSVNYTKLGHLPIALELGTHFKFYTGYIEVTFKPGSLTEIESAVTLTNQIEINNKKDNDNVFYVTNGYFNNVQVGIATVVITAKSGVSYQTGNVVVAQFRINQVEFTVDNLEITNLENSYVYTGSNITPNFYLKSLQTNKTLSLQTDYTIEYITNNVNVGQVSFKVTGVGNYTGSVTYEDKFSITAKQIEKNMFQISPDEVYSGYEQKPTVSGTFNSKSLVLDADFSITFKRDNEVTNNFTDAGIIVITLKGLGNFSGEISHNYTINKLQISTLQLSKTTTIYTGEDQRPNILVLDGNGNTLTKGFRLQFSRNNVIDETENFTDVGEVEISVIITDTLNYELKESSLTGSFTITKATLSTATVSLDNTTLVYTGNSLSPNITVELNGDVIEPSNYELEFSLETEQGETIVGEMINTGSYVIKIKGVGNFDGELQTHFTITRYDISSSSTVLPTDYEKTFMYNGSVQKPTIILKYGNQTLVEKEEFTITYRKEHLLGAIVEEPTDAGTYFIVLMGMGNYTGIVNSLTFEIKPLSLNGEDAEITFVGLDNIEDVDYTFNGTEQKVQIASIKINDIEFFDTEGDYISVIYKRNSEITEDFISAGVINIRVEANNNDNIAGFYDYSYTIKQKTFDSGIIKVSGLEDRPYNREKQIFDITLLDEQANNYELKQDKDYTITFSSDCINVEKDIVATFTPINGNYKGQAFTKTFSINKAVIDSFQLTVNKSVYSSTPHNITATVKAGEFEIYDTETYNEYQLIFRREGSAVTNLTSVGDIEVELVLLDTTNYELKQGLVTRLTYTITKAEISSITLTETGAEFNNQNHTIVIDSVKTKNDLTLKTSDYVVSYIVGESETNNATYKNACTITVKVVATENGNFTGTATTTYTITAREIVETNVSYFEADEFGNATETQFNLIAKYKGKKVAPYVSLNFDDGENYVLNLNNESLDGDYSFGIFTLEDYNSSKANNLFGKETYLLAGEYVFVVMGKNNFTGEITANYKVEPADFNETTIELTIPKTVDFTGSEITVDFESEEVSVIYKKTSEETPLSLALDVDFKLFNGFVEITYLEDNTISSYRVITEEEYNILKTSKTTSVLKIINGYANNIASGVATLVITGAEPNFELDTIILTQFTINRVTLDATITGIDETYTFTGYEIIPELVVTSNDTGLTLVEGVDYTIKYTNNTNVGYAGFLITAMNNYSGVVERNRAFYIEPKQIEAGMFTISENTTYNLTEQKPEISARYNSRIMVEGEDFEVIFKRAGEVTTDFTTAGNITIEIKGINNYSSEYSKVYSIEKWIIKEVKLSVNEVTYNATEQKPNIQVIGINGEEINSAGYEITYSTQDFTNAGSIIIFANIVDNVNYALFSQQVSSVFKINKEDLSKLTTTIENQTFTSLEITPSFTLFLEQNAVAELEYTVTGYADNINAGTAKIIISSNNINYFGTKEIEFVILPKQLEESMYSVVEEKNFVYNGEEQTLDFELRYTLNDSYSTLLARGTDYGVVYENNINANSNNSAVLTITGTNNYSGSLVKRFSIAKANPVVNVDLPLLNLFAGDSLLDENFLILSSGSTKGALTNTTVATLGLANNVSWSFVPEDTNNYNNASGKINVPAYYETKVEFGNVDNLIASSSTNVSVRVTFKMNRKEETSLELPSNNYQIVITRNGFEVSNYEQSGTYNLRIAINNNNYKIVGEDNITFQVKPTTIYSYDNSFYAVCDDGFDVNVSLYVQVFDTMEDIIAIIGEENYAKLDNIQKIYIVELYNDNGPIVTPNAKIYLNTTSNNNYYLLQDEELVLQESVNGAIVVGVNSYIIEVLIPPNNITKFIIFGAIGAGVIIVLIIVIALASKMRKKRKGKTPVQQGAAVNVNNVGVNNGNVQDSNMQNSNMQDYSYYQTNYNAQNYQNTNAQTSQPQNLNTLIGQVNPNANNYVQQQPVNNQANYYQNNSYSANNGAGNLGYVNQANYYNNQGYTNQNVQPQVQNTQIFNNTTQNQNASNNNTNNGGTIYTNNLNKNMSSLNPYSYTNTKPVQNNTLANTPQNNSGIKPLSPNSMLGINANKPNNTTPLNQNTFNQNVNNAGVQQSNGINQNKGVLNSNQVNNSVNGRVNNGYGATPSVNSVTNPTNSNSYQGAAINNNATNKPNSSINPNSVLGNINNNPPKNN